MSKKLQEDALKNLVKDINKMKEKLEKMSEEDFSPDLIHKFVEQWNESNDTENEEHSIENEVKNLSDEDLSEMYDALAREKQRRGLK